MLALTGNLRDDKTPLPVLWSKGFRRFPGRLVKEILPTTQVRIQLQLLERVRRTDGF